MIVDDEQSILDSITDYFESYDIKSFNNAKQAIKEIRTNTYDIIISDFRMPGISGLEFLIEARKINPDYSGILLTAYADKELVEECLNKNLICKVVEKPLELNSLKNTIDEVIKVSEQKKAKESEIRILKSRFEDLKKTVCDKQNKVIGIKKGLKNIFKDIQKSAHHSVNILLTGETGTGKEVIARMIHNLSSRKDNSFVKINCAAIPENLLESELFGYKKGAFTDAKENRIGKIEIANNGTLFLDEIGEIKLSLQSKLLRALQEKEVERLGDNTTIKVDFKLIVATNCNLENLVKENKFREDLYYRINTFPIHLPPLRERLEDIKEFVEYFTTKNAEDMGISILKIDPKIYSFLKQYKWYGNIRELENAITRAIIISKNKNELNTESFSFLFTKPVRTKTSYNDAVTIIRDNIIKSKIDLRKIESDILEKILEYFNGNVLKSVKETGIAKDRFYRNK